MNMGLVIGVVVVPLAVFFINILVRSKFFVPQSAGADFILLLLVFDSTVILNPISFKSIVKYQPFQQDIVAIHLGLLLIGLLLWLGIVTIAETDIAKKYLLNHFRQQNHNFPFFRWLFSWIIGMTLLGGHIIFFIYNP